MTQPVSPVANVIYQYVMCVTCVVMNESNSL